MPHSIRRSLVSLIALLAVAACGGGEAPAPASEAEEEEAPLTNLTEAEQQTLAYLQAPEMQDGRLDTVDMTAKTDDAGWHIRILNYRTDLTAMLYTAWYSGDGEARFAADGQPILVDEDGRTYGGIVTPVNPRIEVTAGYAAVGVMVFQPGVAAEADSLTLFVNQETAPVLKVGPFGVVHDHTQDPSSVELLVE